MLTLLPPDAAPLQTETGHIDLVSAHWNALRGSAPAPRRDLIDAQAIAPALPYVFVAQLLAPRVARLRIVGHKIEALAAYDLRGMPLTSLFMGGARDMIQDACAQVSSGARAHLALDAARKLGQRPLSGQLALFPLADASGQIGHVMGVLDLTGDVAPVRGERRFIMARPVDTAPPATTGRPALRVIQGGKA